jgi:hypothetical protein
MADDEPLPDEERPSNSKPVRAVAPPIYHQQQMPTPPSFPIGLERAPTASAPMIPSRDQQQFAYSATLDERRDVSFRM